MKLSSEATRPTGEPACAGPHDRVRGKASRGGDVAAGPSKQPRRRRDRFRRHPPVGHGGLRWPHSSAGGCPADDRIRRGVAFEPATASATFRARGVSGSALSPVAESSYLRRAVAWLRLSEGSSPGDVSEAAALVLAVQEFVANGGGRPWSAPPQCCIAGADGQSWPCRSAWLVAFQRGCLARGGGTSARRCKQRPGGLPEHPAASKQRAVPLSGESGRLENRDERSFAGPQMRLVLGGLQGGNRAQRATLHRRV